MENTAHHPGAPADARYALSLMGTTSYHADREGVDAELARELPEGQLPEGEHGEVEDLTTGQRWAL